MAKTRSYKLECPIARALDRIGDRWTMLILRDLHAGPARFSDLQRGLTGIAANLLTERLGKLVSDGLAIKRDASHGATLYELTDLGARTQGILFDLAMFGARFPAADDIVPPGNLRTVAFTLGAAAKRAQTPGLSVRVALIVGDEPISLVAKDGVSTVTYGPLTDPDLEIRTRYAALLAVSEGEMSEQVFLATHCSMRVFQPGQDQQALKLMAAIFAVFR